MNLVDLLNEEIASLKVPKIEFELSIRSGWYSEETLHVYTAPAFTSEQFEILRLNDIEGNFLNGVNHEATFLRSIRHHTYRIRDRLANHPSRKKNFKKLTSDLSRIESRIEKLIHDRVLSEIILRTSTAIKNNPILPIEELIKAVELMKTLASKQICDLFTEY